MTPKERVLAAINWQDVDRLPVFAGVTPAAKLIGRRVDKSFMTDGDAVAEAQWAAWKEFGDDIIKIPFTGALEEVFGTDAIWPGDDFPMIKSVLVTGHDVADALPVPDPYKDPIMVAILRAIQILKRRAGNNVIICGHVRGVFNLAARLFGVENLMKYLVRDAELVHKVCRKIVAAQIRYVEAQVEAGAEIIFTPDATSSPSCISPEDYGRHALPFHIEAIKAYKKTGALVIYHPCGGEYPIIDQIGQTGADVFDFSELVDLAVAQKIFAGRHAVAGTVDPSQVLFLGTPEEVREHVREIIERLNFKTGVIIGPGCGLSPNIPYANVKAMVGAVKEYGWSAGRVGNGYE
jgi:uroporphyrinogen decarboxylase